MSCPCLTWPASLLARRGYFRGEPPPRQAVRRIVVLACHWIGDTFWAMQTVPALREAFPEADLFVAVKPHSVDLFNGLLPEDRLIVTRWITSDRHREATSLVGLLRDAARLRELHPDIVVDLTGNRYSALAGFLARPRWCVGFDGDLLRGLYSHRVELPAEVHLADRPFHVIEPLIGRFARPRFLRPVTPKSTFQEVLSQLGLDAKEEVAVVAPGAGWPEKQWSPSGFSAICKFLVGQGLQVVVNGSPKQENLCRKVAGGASLEPKHAAKVKIDTGSIGDMVALLSGTSLVVCNDSAVGHLAAAFGCKVVVLLVDNAHTVGQVAPIGPKVTVLDGTDNRLTIKQVVDQVRDRLS